MKHAILNNLKYAKTHEWLKEESGLCVIGITDFAQSQLGEIVYVELPETNRCVKAAEPCAVIESVKAASDIYSPVSGIITQVNTAAAEATNLVNDDPFGKGWLFKIKPDNTEDIAKLLTAEQYGAQTEKK